MKRRKISNYYSDLPRQTALVICLLCLCCLAAPAQTLAVEPEFALCGVRVKALKSCAALFNGPIQKKKTRKARACTFKLSGFPVDVDPTIHPTLDTQFNIVDDRGKRTVLYAGQLSYSDSINSYSVRAKFELKKKRRYHLEGNCLQTVFPDITLPEPPTDPVIGCSEEQKRAYHEEFNRELANLQYCKVSEECGQLFDKIGCGLTNAPVLRSDANPSALEKILGAIRNECDDDIATTCEVRDVDGFECVNNRCQWHETSPIHIY